MKYYKQNLVNSDGEVMKTIKIVPLSDEQFDILSEQSHNSGIYYEETKEVKKTYERFNGDKSEGIVKTYEVNANRITNDKKNDIRYVEKKKKQVKKEEVKEETKQD